MASVNMELCKQIVENCKKVAKLLGKNAPGSRLTQLCGFYPGDSKTVYCYEDDAMEISYSESNGSLYVTILAAANLSSKCNNPCIMIDGKGEMFRWHGEAYHLENHLEKLIDKILF